MRKRMKRYLLLLASLVLVFSLTGCVEKEIKSPEDLKVSEESFYRQLNNAIVKPDQILGKDLEGEIEFTAMILDQAYDMDFEEEPGKNYRYHTASIARNSNNFFFLDVSDTDEFKGGDIVTIKGSIKGWIYETLENRKVDILDVKADEIKIREEDKPEVESSNLIEIDSGNRKANLTIEKALMPKKLEDSIVEQDYIITIYLEYENLGEEESSPKIEDLGDIYLGDEKLKYQYAPIGHYIKPEGDRMDLMSLASNVTYPGKKSKYYLNIMKNRRDADLDFDQPLHFEEYDDHFNLISYYELDIEKLDQ